MNESKLSFKKKAVRNLFLNYEKKFKTEEEIEKELETTGMAYIQMRLPVEKITEEYEEIIRKRVEKNILRAKIREATKEDLDSVVFLHNRSWMTSSTPFSPISHETIKKIFEYPDTKILIAKVYGTDGGFVILDFEGNNKEYGIIAGLGVLPRFQRKGLGTVIGMAAWDYFKKRGVKELRCEVYKDNNVSYNFIKSLGFEEYDVIVYKAQDFNLSS
ncbi:MAG: GNAT family N-acetyltransferase [Candidatus Lokiarchaeota archaeon]|nr:GNAT family N-acetyltransferase [Candidatus Lokiarchaeota archaeon]